jgi:hypothetical protein
VCHVCFCGVFCLYDRFRIYNKRLAVVFLQYEV